MLTLNGTHNFAHVMCDTIEDSAKVQIENILNKKAFKDSQIRIMADVHAGKGCVVGFSMTLGDYIVPNLVGCDLGCGCLAYNLGNITLDFQGLDGFIKTNIPSGKNVNQENRYQDLLPLFFDEEDHYDFEYSLKGVAGRLFNGDKEKTERVFRGISSLGSGNHYQNLCRDPEGNVWLTIHSGSRNFGLQIWNYHQNKAKELMKKFFLEDEYKDLEFLVKGYGAEEYFNDMQIAQKYAEINREAMLQTIIRDFFRLDPVSLEKIHTIHNYINFRDGILRKGAVSAHAGERLLIPISMKDGIIVATGKGSKKWNYSAPHGAGRLMGRKEAKRTLSMDQFKTEMTGVWSSCIDEDRLDEAPMAYKSMASILGNIGETVDVDFVMPEIYNFKAKG